jgi:hypothetical protein
MNEKELIGVWIERLKGDKIKTFPDAFLISMKRYNFPLPGKALVIGEHFFDMIEITTIDGAPFFQTSDEELAKFIVYANRLKPPSVKIPDDPDEIRRINKEYELSLDNLVREIEADYVKNFPEGKNKNSISNEIFRIVNLVRY